MAEKPTIPTTTQNNEWNDSLSGDFLWSNVNFGEAVTDVMTPLTWSVLQFTLDDWIFLPGISTVGVIGGRPYLNISIFATLFYGLGRSRQDLIRNMESTLYLRLPDDMPIPSIPVSYKTLLQGVICSIRIRLKQRQGVQKTQAYLVSNLAWFQDIRRLIQFQNNEAELYRLWHSRMKTHIKNGVWCVLGSVSYSSEYTLELRRQLEKIAGPQDANLLIANIGNDDTPLESLGPLIGMDKLVRGKISRDAYMEIYGHRGPHEFELSVPRPAEDPTWLEQELEKMRQSPAQVEDLIVKQRQSFNAAWSRLQKCYPREAARVQSKIAESARRARLREQTRSAYIRDRWSIRLFALRAGELTGLGDRVFFLTLNELLAILSGDRSVTHRIEPRMGAYQQYKSLPSYPSVIRGRFDPFTWSADPNRPTDIYDAHKTHATSILPNHVTGSPGSAGVVEGVVRIMENPVDNNQFQQGEILVAIQTDISWTLIFPKAAAVVTDIGAPLSHAAIVARELGIPAVVGCGNATTRLKTGYHVRVDGGRGTVEILSTG
jgi:rifampicin phosphotransferase